MSFDRLNSKRRAALPANAITLPYRFRPRSYQLPVLSYLERGGLRALVIHHRKSGKDTLAFNYMVWAAAKRPGLYMYLGPDAVQLRRICWDGIHAGQSILDGASFLSHVPPQMIVPGGKNETEMSLKLYSAGGQFSIIQFVGSDRFERLRGPAPVGLVLTEYSYFSTAGAWEALSPALGATGGWALFPFTPNGPNFARDLRDYAQSDPTWFVDVKTVDETRKDAPGEDGSRVVPQKYIESERARGVPEEFISQEYYCDFSGIRTGSYYGELLARADAENRITDVPYNPMLPAECWFDLGKGQSLAVWIVQTTNAGLVRVVDCLEGKPDEDVSHIARALLVKPYTYSGFVFPWDANPYAEFGRVDWAERLGLRPVIVNARLPVDDGISAVKAMLPRCVFDSARCAAGLKALRAYHREYDDKANTFKPTPRHDWASHFADAFRTGAIGTRGADAGMAGAEVKVEQDFDPRISMGREW